MKAAALDIFQTAGFFVPIFEGKEHEMTDRNEAVHFL